jgi:putative acetyltransferase
MEFETRRATESDAAAIAEAHLDSIRSLGPQCYPAGVVADWSEGLGPGLYLEAMARGEVFFIAIGEIDGKRAVLGFASDYRIDGSQHGASAYVRGAVARRGIGSALLRLAETQAIARGARTITIEASLTGLEFYRAHGFVEIGRGETHLRSGRPIACVFMEKQLRDTTDA